MFSSDDENEVTSYKEPLVPASQTYYWLNEKKEETEGAVVHLSFSLCVEEAGGGELNIDPPTPCQQQAPVQTKTQGKWPANQDPEVPGQRAHGGGCLGSIQGAGSQPEAEGPTPTSRGALSPLPAEGPPTWGDPGEGGCTLHRAPVGQGPSGPGWLATALGFWSGRALATGTAWAGLCLIHHHHHHRPRV